MTYTLIALAWYATGVASYLYWNNKMRLRSDLPLTLYAGFFGGFTFFIGWIIYIELTDLEN